MRSREPGRFPRREGARFVSMQMCWDYAKKTLIMRSFTRYPTSQFSRQVLVAGSGHKLIASLLGGSRGEAVGGSHRKEHILRRGVCVHITCSDSGLHAKLLKRTGQRKRARKDKTQV